VVRAIPDPRLRYVRRAVNGGAAGARNTGLEAATGQFVAFQDSDDIWLPNKLERQISLLESLPQTVGVVTGAKIVYGIDAAFKRGHDRVALAPPPRSRLRLEDNQVERLMIENRLSVQCAVFRIACYPHRRWFDSCARANEDWEFAVRLARHTKIYEDADPVVLGFVSNDSISSQSRKQTIGLIRVIRKNRDFLATSTRARAVLLFALARALLHHKRARRGARALLAALRTDPRATAGEFQSTLKRKVARRFSRD
jgi:glycosyltransferase involved in cell wall biosynthesis